MKLIFFNPSEYIFTPNPNITGHEIKRQSIQIKYYHVRPINLKDQHHMLKIEKQTINSCINGIKLMSSSSQLHNKKNNIKPQ
jgi:hypothetical protein